MDENQFVGCPSLDPPERVACTGFLQDDGQDDGQDDRELASSATGRAQGRSSVERRAESGTWRLSLNGHSVVATEVFWSYWFLAAERQSMFYSRVSGEPAPWTDDDVLARHRFTNAYRASDRVSQYLLQRVIYDRDHDTQDTILRVLLFKIFNRIDTWEHLVASAGEPDVASFDPETYGRILDERLRAGEARLLCRLHHAQPQARLFSKAPQPPRPSRWPASGRDTRPARQGGIARGPLSSTLEHLILRLVSGISIRHRPQLLTALRFRRNGLRSGGSPVRSAASRSASRTPAGLPQSRWWPVWQRPPSSISRISRHHFRISMVGPCSSSTARTSSARSTSTHESGTPADPTAVPVA